jgi:exosortase
MSSAHAFRRAFPPLFPVVIPLVAAYWFVIASLALQWSDDPNYAHGFFVIPMAAMLAWRRRTRWQAASARPDTGGLLMLAAAGVLYLVGILAAELFTTRVSLVLAVAAIVYALEGKHLKR